MLLACTNKSSRPPGKSKSDGVFQVCMATEKYIRLLLRNNNNFLFHIKDIDVLISNEILKQLGPKCDKLFEDIKDHMFDFETGTITICYH